MSQTTHRNPAEIDSKWIRRFFVSLFLLIGFLVGGASLLLRYGEVLLSMF